MAVRVAGARNIALNELNLRGISVNDATNGSATINIVASDSGIVFINKFATNTTYNLPAVASGAGKWFWFFDGQATNTSAITSPTANTLVSVNAAANTTVTSSAGAGQCGIIMGDGSYYYFFEIIGTWACT